MSYRDFSLNSVKKIFRLTEKSLDLFLDLAWLEVSNGQFLKLENHLIFINTQRYYISELGKVLWILQYIVDAYQAQSE